MTYLRSVEAAGGTPVLLPNSPVAENVAAVLAGADGLLLTGGGDIHPELFGQELHPKTTFVDRVRDETERLAVREALRGGIPVLAICRGIQVLAVAMGGTLIQHIPDYLGGRDGDCHPRNVDHPIRTDGGSILSGLWPAGLVVNSRHHQAVDAPGESLKITGRAPDGIVEALESDDGHPVLGLQCHPELLSADRPEFAAPFEWLIEQAASRRA